VAAEPLQKWDGRQASRCRQGYQEGPCLFPVLGDRDLMTKGHQKWDGKSKLCCPTFKSETEFAVSAV